MKAIKVELIMEDNIDANFFVTEVLPKLKKEYKMKQVMYSDCNYFEGGN